MTLHSISQAKAPVSGKRSMFMDNRHVPGTPALSQTPRHCPGHPSAAPDTPALSRHCPRHPSTVPGTPALTRTPQHCPGHPGAIPGTPALSRHCPGHPGTHWQPTHCSLSTELSQSSCLGLMTGKTKQEKEYQQIHSP